MLVSLGGPSGSRVGLTVRGRHPAGRGRRRAGRRCWPAACCTDRPRAVLVARGLRGGRRRDRCRGRGPAAPRAGAGAGAGARRGPACRCPSALLVRGGRWWSYDCPRRLLRARAPAPRCPRASTELEVAAVATGMVVASGPRRPGRADRAARRRPDRRRHGGGVRPGGRRRARRTSSAAAGTRRPRSRGRPSRAAVGRCRPGAPAARLTDDEVARIALGPARRRRPRPGARSWPWAPDAAAAEALWTECTRRAPAPLDAAPATLLAVSAWLRGDGAMAERRARAGRSTASRATASPGCCAQALDACLRPAELRALIGRVAGRVRAARRGAAEPGGPPAALRAARAAATPRPARARPGRRAPSRTRPCELPGRQHPVVLVGEVQELRRARRASAGRTRAAAPRRSARGSPCRRG